MQTKYIPETRKRKGTWETLDLYEVYSWDKGIKARLLGWNLAIKAVDAQELLGLALH